jgi:hypothetical protein
MRTAHEKMHDAEFLTPDEKSVRRVEEAGVIRTPVATRKLANERLRVAICELTDANITNVQKWLDAISTEDPAKALDIILRMLEFSVPKLSRVEAVVSPGSTTGDLGDLSIRDLQDMVLRARKDGSIEGECEELSEADKYAGLI